MSRLLHFHVSRAARQKYGMDESLFSIRGTLVFANFYAARLLAQRINAARDLARQPELAVQAGELNALGLIHEIFHYILEEYRRQRGDVMAQAAAALDEQLGPAAVATTLVRFVDEFPPLPVYRGELTPQEYLNASTAGIPNRETVLEELVLVWLQNQNPAASPFHELFDDTVLVRDTAYPAVIRTLRAFFAEQEPIGPARQTLFELLRTPFLHAPSSLGAQLDFMLKTWQSLGGPFDLSRFTARVLGGLQLIQEEDRYLFARQAGAFGGGGFTSTAPPVPTFAPVWERGVDAFGRPIWYEPEPEPEQFSLDLDWMPRLVLIAKSTYVWLDQLSKKYSASITRLDQIPDAELDELARRGITGLWFIGVWERSPASARIKHMMGNPGAISSAYSLSDYEVAADLGGPDALASLQARAWQRGIRLASDMVPNHMGLDSRWVVEHPDRFISSAVPPYPSYTFTGMDVSSDPRVTIQIEDHYWDRTDAAVVFKRTDRATGAVTYIYHGNDGTSFPWNDTAQLDYLKREVREQVIQAILHVARRFPVIRFDAAMTLAKKHFERLWYPLPGETNTIPSRGEYAMPKADFDAAMPEEFWREVVDRVAQEAPDTLLLAEAFWLMEGYFVRTLGMHRVYNSAFMHMLRDERNQEYRLVIKNTIEFDPEVLKRYVNFMNNPDERTAVDQFGKGDRYFGVCLLMATLPGLPMFGHGQIEGFNERYGMEFRTALLDESPDPWLLDRHAREIFPLLHRRYLFAGVENFLLYDVYRADGGVEENVFAFSNRARGPRGIETALVIFNNAYASARGTIRLSAAYRDKGRDALVQRTLAEGLDLPDADNVFVILREMHSGQEFIRRARDLARLGFEVALDGYQSAVYLDFRQVADTPDMSYTRLHDRLHGRGVPSIDAALRELNLEPLHNAVRALVNTDTLRALASSETAPDLAAPATALARVVNEWNETTVPEAAFADTLAGSLARVAQLVALRANLKRPAAPLKAALTDLETRLADPSLRDGLFVLAFAQAMQALVPGPDAGPRIAALLDEWQLGTVFSQALQSAGIAEARAWQLVSLIKLTLAHPDPLAEPASSTPMNSELPTRASSAPVLSAEDAPELTTAPLASGAGLPALPTAPLPDTSNAPTPAPVSALSTLLSEPAVAALINVNRFDEVLWFNREAFDALTSWLQAAGALSLLSPPPAAAALRPALIRQSGTITRWRAAAAASDYRVESLLTAAFTPLAPPRRRASARAALAPAPRSTTESDSQPSTTTTTAPREGAAPNAEPRTRTRKPRNRK